MSEETQPEIQVKNEMMATRIMEMGVTLIETLKKDGLDQEEVHLLLTPVLHHEDMGLLQHL
jgi:hypothetical protein